MLARVKTPKSLTRALRRPTALLGAGALAASLALTGCSGSDTEAYCDSLEGAKSDIDALEAGDPGAFSTAFEAFDTLADDHFIAVFPRDHALARRKTVSLASVVRYPFLALAPRTNVRTILESAFAQSLPLLRLHSRWFLRQTQGGQCLCPCSPDWRVLPHSPEMDSRRHWC